MQNGRIEIEGCGADFAGSRGHMTDTVLDITDAQLLERAVKGARPRKGRVPRWFAVSEAFGLGSTYSIQLCRRFGIEPDQQIGRTGVVR